MLKTPIIVNFKAYKQSTGKNAVKLAKLIAKAGKGKVAVAVQVADIAAVKKAVRIPVLAQHVDPVEFGKKTGSILPESVKEAGAVGTLLNHSEKRIDLGTLKDTIDRCRKAKLTTVVCAHTPKLAIMIAGLKPNMIAIEPPELIGGRISVSTARPEVITETTGNIKRIPVYCGAGVHTAEDVKIARKLGAKGVLLASGVVLAKKPAEVIKQLLKGLTLK